MERFARQVSAQFDKKIAWFSVLDEICIRHSLASANRNSRMETAEFSAMNFKNIKEFKVNVRSSIIEYLAYDYIQTCLIVKFKSNRYGKKLRTYEEVSISNFLEILAADSIGRTVLKLHRHSN